MTLVVSLLKKEFLQVFRNKTLLPLIFVLPMVQLLVLVNAANQEMRNIRVMFVDNDLSSFSRRMVGAFDASEFFIVKNSAESIEQAREALQKRQTDLVVVIPHQMEHDVYRQGTAKVQILVDAVNSTTAQLGFVYASSVIGDLNKKINLEHMAIHPEMKSVNVTSLFWFNPSMNYKYYMLPGILVILVTIIGMFLSAMNLVREKEMGTIEQINVSPIKKWQFILAKLVPFWIIGLFELALGLLIGKVLYNIPFEGNLLVLFAFAAIYLVAVLGIGLFISTITNTQQQVMFISFFFILVFVLMSGVFTATENMPPMGRYFNSINPVYYFMKVIRMIVLKGSGFRNLANEFIAITLYAISILSLAIFNYRKTV